MNTNAQTNRARITEQAAEWVVELRTPPDETTRASFVEWITASPAHLLLFMELVEVEYRFKRLDPQAMAEIRAVLAQIPRP